MRAPSGHGDVLNYEQVQAVNTELDRHDYESCIIVTLGDLAGEARTLAHQLASRKPITILERSEVVRRAVQNVSPGMEVALKDVLEEDLSAACLVFTDKGLAVLIQERTANGWFQVFGEDGTLVPESAELVLALRKELPSLRTIRYRSHNLGEMTRAVAQAVAVTFNREEYLRRSHDYFDDVRYAPLAALGFRFKKASLSEIYVEASADVGGSTKASLTLTRAVSEFVESLSLPQAQRDQLESQLRSRHGLNRTAEVGAARKLYQRYNNVVVLGDPGSGKTCFVQHEILAYCESEKESMDWYSQHLPVYVSLAEAARLLDGKTSLLDICEIVSSRRGIELPRGVIESNLADGRIAFFFDGLDEVGFIDKRIALLTEIDSLVKAHAPRGNRFVIASRPAAVQPVEIPEALTYLHLKGLTEDEIRLLAGRVLTTRVADQAGGSLNEDETELVNRLLEDTHNSPGIARIARNPLLLTLLVLIYANTGALSARRHVIYTQAIKTLVSVRGRQTREQRISETDLRGRLGALALAIFRREIAEIPKRSEVLALLGPLVTAQSKGGSSKSHADVADAFLQEVAEASGLLTIHSRDDGRSEDLITFMHYSFLEYYAAAGLLARDYLTMVPELAGNPRWKDVTTLLFGILSEQGDITELLDRILSDSSPAEAISQYKTILAIDCANECDVPPEIAQARLAAAIYETISHGAGRYSAKVRTEVAQRLQSLLRGAGLGIEAAVAQGLRENDPIAAAAFADLVARVDDDLPLPEGIVEAFASCLQNENAVTRAACLFAIELRPELRDERAREIVRQSLKGSLVEKHAALKVIAAVPRFGESLRDELRYLLDDPNTLISATAAQCLLAAVLRGSHFLEKPPYLEKALSKLDQDAGQEAGLALRGITFDRGVVQDLIHSDDSTKVELAIRHVSLVKGDDQFVYSVLIESVRNASSDRHKAAALSTLLNCDAAIDLITISDTDVICTALEDPTRNVRIAAAKLLGEMPDDEQVVRSLQAYLEHSAAIPSRDDEVTEAAKALAKHVRRNPRIRQQTIKTLAGLLPKNPQEGFGDPGRQGFIVALLSVCESIGGATDNGVAWRLNRIAEDFKTPLPIRRQAIRAFGRLVEPSAEGARVFVRALQRDDRRLNDAVYAGAAAFVSQCHRRVEYVRRVHQVLQELLTALCDAWQREISRSVETIEPPALREIREGIVEIRNLSFAYEEFSERAKLAS